MNIISNDVPSLAIYVGLGLRSACAYDMEQEEEEEKEQESAEELREVVS